MNKVLIIDDDKELCVLIKRSVLSEDIEADFCNTGKEGLQKLKEKEYQLVILDVMMPGMDGFETLEEIRKENSLPILMFTSKNDSASKVRGLRAGADDYLTKPFDMDELIARIISLIRRYTRFNQTDGMTQQLEFDGLKIDKSFIDKLTESHEGQSIVEGIINLGHAISMTVIAEGVETAEQLTYLQSLHCDEVQG